MNKSSCPICASDSTKVIYSAARDYITGENFKVYACNSCRIAYTFPMPSDLSAFYPEKYRHYNPLILIILEFLYNIRAQKWSGMFRVPGVAFEMGCGNGIMLKTLRQHGWQVLGNERTVAAADFARHKLRLPIFVGGIDSINPTSFADLIILFQVLEHLQDPLSTLRQLNQIIQPQGKLIIAVPNFGAWQSKFGGEKWFHLDVPRHHFHFSLPALEFCLKESGFEIVQVSFASLEHDPFGWVQSILNRLYKKQNHLTRLLIGLDRPIITDTIHIGLAIAIWILSLPMSVTSWIFQRGAIIEIVAQKSTLRKNLKQP